MDETQELASTEPAIHVDAPTLSVTQTGHTIALEPGQQLAAAEPGEVPEVVGRYRVEGLLGRRPARAETKAKAKTQAGES